MLEIETSDPAMRDWIPPAAGRTSRGRRAASRRAAAAGPASGSPGVVILGVGGYLPPRIVDQRRAGRATSPTSPTNTSTR